jgi:hypothetical protein
MPSGDEEEIAARDEVFLCFAAFFEACALLKCPTCNPSLTCQGAGMPSAGCLREFDRERTSQIELSIKTLLETETSHRGPLLVSPLTSIAVSATGTSVTSPSIRAAYRSPSKWIAGLRVPFEERVCRFRSWTGGTRCTKRAASLRRQATNPLQDRSCFEGEASKQSRLPRPARSEKWRAFLSAPRAGTTSLRRSVLSRRFALEGAAPTILEQGFRRPSSPPVRHAPLCSACSCARPRTT